MPDLAEKVSRAPRIALSSRKSAKISEITHLGLYLIFQANLADCMKYSLRNGGLPRRQTGIWRFVCIRQIQIWRW